MLSTLIAFWATPRMSVGHLLFAAGMTLYVVVGIAFEERDLLAAHGEPYARYRSQVAMLAPLRALHATGLHRSRLRNPLPDPNRRLEFLPADQVEDLRGWVESADAAIRGFAREKPVVALACAVGIGFLIGRLASRA